MTETAQRTYQDYRELGRFLRRAAELAAHAAPVVDRMYGDDSAEARNTRKLRGGLAAMCGHFEGRYFFDVDPEEITGPANPFQIGGK